MVQPSQPVSSEKSDFPQAQPLSARGYAARNASSPLGPFSFTRRSPSQALQGRRPGGSGLHGRLLRRVRELFVLRVPESLDRAAAAPLLCAGITTHSPLRHWNVTKN